MPLITTDQKMYATWPESGSHDALVRLSHRLMAGLRRFGPLVHHVLVHRTEIEGLDEHGLTLPVRARYEGLI